MTERQNPSEVEKATEADSKRAQELDLRILELKNRRLVIQTTAVVIIVLGMVVASLFGEVASGAWTLTGSAVGFIFGSNNTTMTRAPAVVAPPPPRVN